MNPAESQETASNPIDVVEHILNRQAYELERRSRNEVVVEIKGRWNEMLLFFSSVSYTHLTLPTIYSV